ncbi:SDR family oxidoreductase [Cohaesibacter gelatinilyticus]|uniref:Uncharacterized conserved protein YbjT, contains NAD(P)-binding and DUF2867 domains n=1 Tax=Cohaesibacter gelatinilyticus TaxID=372072 RepID=A0A285PCZ6_9HYPH|nr:SDR family oxidoreductase [Cohaesibacter gelatinilyticus]SNZ19582.1 Uncharacterized conserved protein YbjT, contains NAD(P)-binding and DUF2867 domains [Cohaesibacter gelatinilyticus]
MKSILVAGATGYLGRHIVKHYMDKGFHVRALVRDAARAKASGLMASDLFEGEATRPQSLTGLMKDIDLVISALGITRQRDNLSYRDVDFQANDNLLTLALEANVEHFAYVHVLHAKAMKGVPMVDAKQAFAEKLQAAPIRSTLICPSGFFSDMADFYAMSKSGRIWLFGDGSHKLNPIDGKDLAVALADAIAQKKDMSEIGGPDIFSQRDIAELAFAIQSKPTKITYLPDSLRKLALWLLPWVTPKHIHGPALMFLTAFGMDMVGKPHGSKTLTSHFKELAEQDKIASSNGVD